MSDKMPIHCPKNQKIGCRYRKIYGGRKQKLCGCMKNNRFLKIKEFKTIK